MIVEDSPLRFKSSTGRCPAPGCAKPTPCPQHNEYVRKLALCAEAYNSYTSGILGLLKKEPVMPSVVLLIVANYLDLGAFDSALLTGGLSTERTLPMVYKDGTEICHFNLTLTPAAEACYYLSIKLRYTLSVPYLCCLPISHFHMSADELWEWIRGRTVLPGPTSGGIEAPMPETVLNRIQWLPESVRNKTAKKKRQWKKQFVLEALAVARGMLRAAIEWRDLTPTNVRDIGN